MKGEATVLAGLNVSRETLGRLEAYNQLLKKWNPKINLVSKATVAEAWDRHIVDSAQVFGLCDADHWLDLGSGGGFPGCVVAILAHELSPQMKVTMIESDQRKAVFLKTVLRETGVAGTVISERIEKAEPQAANVISARALAALSDLLEYFQLHAADGAQALYMKGASWKEEIETAQEQWKFEYEAVSSKTQSDAVILRITGVERG